MPSVHRVTLSLVALVAAMATSAACAGDGESASTTTTTATPTTTSTTSTIAPPGERLFVFSLGPGECFDERVVVEPAPGATPGTGPDGGEAPGEPVPADFRVDCSLPHQNEVFVVLEHPAPPAQPYPTEEQLDQYVADNCHSQFEDYVGKRYELSELEVGVRTPTPEQWVNEGDRRIVCYLHLESGEKLTGPVAGTGR